MDGIFAILNPCAKKWSDLQGDGHARFCATCKTHVHLIADYSPNEWKKLWDDSKGHVCGFLGNLPAPPRSRRAILAGALLTAVSQLFAASGRVKFRVIDLAGAPVSKANIAVLDSEDKAAQSVESDEFGEAILTGLPLGDFAIRRYESGVRKTSADLDVSQREGSEGRGAHLG
jgi:hypothetical protein